MPGIHPLHTHHHQYQQQHSPQTLRQGLDKYFAAYPGVASMRDISPAAHAFFSSHDTVHVIYGCSTSLRDEAVVKIASIFGTTGGFSVLKGYALHESREIYGQLSAAAVLRSLIPSAVAVPLTVARCAAQKARWPWSHYDEHLLTPIADLRERFGIRVG